MLSSLIGYVTGLLFAFGVAALVERLAARISIAFSWEHFAAALAAALAMSLLASYIPLRKINSIDPVIVFKA